MLSSLRRLLILTKNESYVVSDDGQEHKETLSGAFMAEKDFEKQLRSCHSQCLFALSDENSNELLHMLRMKIAYMEVVSCKRSMQSKITFFEVKLL